MKTTRERLAELFQTVLEMDSIPEDASSTTVASWDSVRHLNLIVAAEELFGINFDTEEISELTSFRAFAEAVERHLAKAGPAGRAAP